MVSQVEYKRKFLVVIDETEECDRAVTFAAWRVKRTGGTVVLMTVVPKPEFIGLGVEDVLRAEAGGEAERNLDRRMARIKEIGDVRAEAVIREGNGPEQIERVIALASDHGAIAFAEEESRKRSDDAVRLLEALPDVPQRQLLGEMLEFFVYRAF